MKILDVSQADVHGAQKPLNTKCLRVQTKSFAVVTILSDSACTGNLPA